MLKIKRNLIQLEVRNVCCKRRTFIKMTLWHLCMVERVKGLCWRHGVGRGCRPPRLITEWELRETFKWGGVCFIAHVKHILHLLRDCCVISVSTSSVQYVCFNWPAEGLKNRVVLYYWTTGWLALCVESRDWGVRIKECFDGKVKLVWLLR